MKKCPQCGREYDTSMMFCLDDGAELLYGPATVDEPTTALLTADQISNEQATRSFGQVLTTGETSFHSQRPVRSRKNSIIAGVIGMIAVTALGIGSYFYYGRGSANQISSIAVMPFVNESSNADVEYLADGMSETLIKSLTNLQDLDVKPRSAVFRYKGKDIDLPTIGKELNVQAILNGRVVQRGELLTLSLELVDVEKNRVIWTEQYQRRQADVVLLQSEIAKDVSAKLSSKLSGAEEVKVYKQATTDPAAYQAYLRGRFYWNKRTGDDMYRAIEHFQIAIDRDPNYALALAGIADTYSVLPDYAMNAPADSFSRAEEFAKRAIALEGELAEPHGTLGNVFYSKWRWADAESEYKRAIELNPNYATAYHWYSVLLFSLGRNEEAAATITRAHELDPMSNIIGQNYAQMLRMKGDHKSAIEVCQKIIELDPTFPGGHFAIAWSYIKTGRNDEAIAEFQKAAELNGRYSASLAELGAAFALTGRTGEAQELMRELEDRYRNKKAKGVDLAAIQAAFGDKDKAFEWLEKDLAARSNSLSEFRWSPTSEPLRDDPRFKDFLRKMGLPE